MMATKLGGDGRGDTQTTRHDTATVAVAALVSLLLSPLIAVWAIVVAAPVVTAAWLLGRAGQAWTRHVALIGVGVLLGTLPYLFLAVLNAFGGIGPSGSGSS